MPRRIVLLSDGTGNSSAKVWRTNVWRMFCALDLTSNDQVACYDDGVGSSSFKPLAILGGAFGIGLRRNVISLYKFACRNFRVILRLLQKLLGRVQPPPTALLPGRRMPVIRFLGLWDQSQIIYLIPSQPRGT